MIHYWQLRRIEKINTRIRIKTRRKSRVRSTHQKGGMEGNQIKYFFSLYLVDAFLMYQ